MKQASAVPTQRNSAVELLRIVSMLMIVYSHICYHSGFDSTYSIMTLNRLFVQFGNIGNMGVVLFLLISGYFLSGKPFRTQSLSRLLSQVWFYSIIAFLVCHFGFGWEYDSLLPVFFPTLYNEYWFFTVYFLLLILTPFLNKMIANLTKQQYETLLWVMIFFWIVMPTLIRQNMYGTEFPQFLLFYLLGGYFRKYPDNLFRKRMVSWCLTLGSFLLLIVLTVVLGYLERYTPSAFGAAIRFYDRNSLIVLGGALGLFTLAVYGKPFTSRFLNTVSGCTFGVYLIHDNPAIRKLLWQDWLHWGDYFTSGSFIPRLIASVLLVYTVCTLIEWLRQKTVAKPLAALLEIPLRKLMGKGDFS